VNPRKMERKILNVAKKLEQASKAHAGQAKALRKILDASKKSKKRR
jgi:nitrate reductase assembly molybdenum cofactor insertion protein NarJ